jgi:hypothetical protein
MRLTASRNEEASTTEVEIIRWLVPYLLIVKLTWAWAGFSPPSCHRTDLPSRSETTGPTSCRGIIDPEMRPHSPRSDAVMHVESLEKRSFGNGQ